MGDKTGPSEENAGLIVYKVFSIFSTYDENKGIASQENRNIRLNVFPVSYTPEFIAYTWAVHNAKTKRPFSQKYFCTQ